MTKGSRFFVEFTSTDVGGKRFFRIDSHLEPHLLFDAPVQLRVFLCSHGIEKGRRRPLADDS